MEFEGGSHLPPLPGTSLLIEKEASLVRQRAVDCCTQTSNPARSTAGFDEIAVRGFHQHALHIIQSTEQNFFAAFAAGSVCDFRAQLFHYRFITGTKGGVVGPAL